MVLVVVNRSATSGSAALRALPSSRDEVTAFQLTRYSPAWSSSTPWAVSWALIPSLMASASAWASSISRRRERSSRILLYISFMLMV